MGRDSGVFAYMGRLILRGGVPYVDFWDHKPPGIYLIDALALAVSSDGAWGLWAMSSLAALAALAIGSVVLCRVCGVRAGLIVSLLYASALVDPRVYEGGNLTEVYALGFQWMTLMFITGEHGRPLAAAFAAGVAGGASVAIKPTTSAIAVAVVLERVWAARSTREARRDLAAFVVGLAVVPAMVSFWLMREGAVVAAIDCIVTFNRTYATGEPGRALVRAVVKTLTKDPVSVLGILACASLVVRRPVGGPRTLSRLTLVALPFEILWLAVSGRFYGHYFLTLLPVLSVRSGIFVATVVARPWFARRWAPLVIALSALLAIRLSGHLVRDSLRRVEGRRWQRAAVTAVQSGSRRGEPVLVWGAEVAINFLADRPIPSAYGYVYPLLMPGYTSPAMWDRFMSDLRRHPPGLILDASARAPVPPLAQVMAGASAPDAAATTAPELRGFLRGYRAERLAGGTLLLRRQ